MRVNDIYLDGANDTQFGGADSALSWSVPDDLLSVVLDSVDEGIVVYDRELRVRVWNRFLEHATHVPAELMKGERPFEMWPQLRSAGFEAFLRRALNGETIVHDQMIGRDSRTGELKVIAAVPSDVDDGTVWLLNKFGPLRVGGEIVGVIGTALNVSAIARTQASLVHSNEKLRRLNQRFEEMRETERTRIAREVHDGLGGLLTGIKANVNTMIDDHVRLNVPIDRRLTRTSELADSAVDAVRRTIADLRPSVLDQLGLWSALEWLTNEVASATTIAADFEISDEALDTQVDVRHSTALFRITQEALTNVVRHANAQLVSVCVDVTQAQLVIAIEDDGTGIDEVALSRTDAWGLIGMQERARLAGGEFRVDSSRSGGTLALVCVPVDAVGTNPAPKEVHG